MIIFLKTQRKFGESKNISKLICAFTEIYGSRYLLKPELEIIKKIVNWHRLNNEVTMITTFSFVVQKRRKLQQKWFIKFIQVRHKDTEMGYSLIMWEYERAMHLRAHCCLTPHCVDFLNRSSRDAGVEITRMNKAKRKKLNKCLWRGRNSWDPSQQNLLNKNFSALFVSVSVLHSLVSPPSFLYLFSQPISISVIPAICAS